jgi:glycosyltransferase involved in cell wall biosynthesis
MYDIPYINFEVIRKPFFTFGAIRTLILGRKFILNYIRENNIQGVMPRSTMPAILVNSLKIPSLKVIFDADGLPLEERIENGSLNRRNLIYKYLFAQERKIIKGATAVLVRSNHAINYHLSRNEGITEEKFFRVENGRDISTFKFNLLKRRKLRNELNISEDDKLLIYVGSLGEKYALAEMLKIFDALKKLDSKFKFLLVTPSLSYLDRNVTPEVLRNIIVRSVRSEDVPGYISAADFGFCLINQSLSMEAVAATKLGEYLISGIPIIVTSKIGDINLILEGKDCCCLLQDHSEAELRRAVSFIYSYDNKVSREEISSFGVNNFSLEKSIKSYWLAIQNVMQSTS